MAWLRIWEHAMKCEARLESGTVSVEVQRAETPCLPVPRLDPECACSMHPAPSAGSGSQRWASMPVKDRVRVLRAARRLMAERAQEFPEAIWPGLARSKADTLMVELVPLLAGCRFLERKAERILSPRRLGWSGRPVWLAGVAAEVLRIPLGHVLVIGPSNFPLFIPGSQVLQALAAGNRVTWKPGQGGEAVALQVARALADAGLPDGVLTVTDESVEAAQRVLATCPDKVVFTGSSRTGHLLLKDLAESATPAVLELSGADAMVVTPSADLQEVARMVAFGLRLNGAAVCLSPRRLLATPKTMAALRPLLQEELAKVPAVPLEARTAERLRVALEEAAGKGAEVKGAFQPEAQRPLVVDRASAEMAVASSDLFAPVISLLEAESMLHVPQLYATCAYGLGVSIFCDGKDEKMARMLGSMLNAGTLLINDIIVPTADPRVPFGGRGESGYGVTRGAEGLLEMTAVKTVLVRRGGVKLHLDPPRGMDQDAYGGLIQVMYGKGLGVRWAGVKRLLKAMRS